MNKGLFDNNNKEISRFSVFVGRLKRIFVRKFGITKRFVSKKEMIYKSKQTKDENKRKRILVSSFLLTLVFVLGKLYVEKHVGLSDIVLWAVGYAVIGCVFLWWMFKGEIVVKSWVVDSLLAGISIFTFVLFIELFYFQSIVRFYEMMFFFFMLLMYFVFLYVLFLTVNIFNVARYQDLPLLQVAQTVGYSINLVAIYLICYLFFAFNTNMIYGIWILWILLSALLYPLINTFNHPKKITLLYSTSIGWVGVLLFISVSFLPVSVKLGILYPVLGVALTLGLMMNAWRQRLNKLLIVEYFAIFIIVTYFYFQRLI